LILFAKTFTSRRVQFATLTARGKIPVDGITKGIIGKVDPRPASEV
jgi:hypothetical protein